MRQLGLIAFCLAVALAPPVDGHASRCGNCPLEPLGWGAPGGAYRFDQSVPEHVQQAAYWADDSWGYNYHDENDPNATTISVQNMGPGYYGSYDGNGNTITISQHYADQCVSACNMLISVLAHEFGHTAGVADITAGCETSIMSYDRNREVVIGPSWEDECWFQNWNAGPNWQCPELPCVPYDQSGRGGGRGRAGRGGGGGAGGPAVIGSGFVQGGGDR